MSSILLDSSCLVAAVCGWHEHHELTRAAIERALRRGDRFVMAAHAVAEAYAVLTRLPHPHRLSSEDAWTLLEKNWGSCRAVGLSAEEYWALLREAAAAGIAGGLVYDALVAFSARKAKAAELWTWNAAHFRRLDAGGAQVRIPAEVSK